MAWPRPPRATLFIHTLRIVSQVLSFRMGFKCFAFELWHLRRGQLYRSGILARLPNPAAHCCVPDEQVVHLARVLQVSPR